MEFISTSFVVEEGTVLGKGDGGVCANGSSSCVHVILYVPCEHSLVQLALYLVEQSVEEALMHFLPTLLEICEWCKG